MNYHANSTQRIDQAETVQPVASEEKTNWKKAEYGKTVGEPKLSEKAQKYYEQLVKKFGNYDFVLVSSDQKSYAKANASKYANSFKPVVLIDEEKIERMATDENYRAKYEGILSGAQNQLEQLKSSMESSGANVKGYGIQVNDNGTLSYFAVLKEANIKQKARIEHSIAKRAAQRRAFDKKMTESRAQARAEEKAEAKKAETKKAEAAKDAEAENGREWPAAEHEKTTTLSAGSIEELMQKINDHVFAQKSDTVLTEQEMMIGQTIDFKG